jgi:Photosynthesis affected mutant 68
MASEPERQSLPFEPKKASVKASRPASEVTKPSKVVKPANKSAKANTAKVSASSPVTRATSVTPNSISMKRPSKGATAKTQPQAIPEVVSRRMIKRMVIFSGIPTGLGLSSFVVAYVLITRHIVDFPKVIVLLLTIGCFGLGVVGLSYGVLSASWEEESEGSFWGLTEFSLNFGRMVQAWREAKGKQAKPDSAT